MRGANQVEEGMAWVGAGDDGARIYLLAILQQDLSLLPILPFRTRH